MKDQLRPLRLIQRGVIRRPLNDWRNARLSMAVQMDYMGAAEFEFGALPESIKAFESHIDEVKLTLIPLVCSGGAFKGPTVTKMLRVLHVLNDQDLETYTDYLKALWDNDAETHRRLKEAAQFSYAEHRWNGSPYDTDFWWDIKNHAMWSFDKVFMDHLVENLAESIKYMREMRALDAKEKQHG